MIEEENEPPLKKEEEKPMESYKILGLNLLAFALYTVGAITLNGDSGDGAVAGLMFAGFHFVICTITAIATKRVVWFLSGLLILIIGFGTCVSNFKMGSMN